MKYLLIFLILFTSSLQATNRCGPDYYEFKTAVDEKAVDDKELEKKPQAQVSSTQIMASLKAMHEEALNTSILKPTAQNILHERMLSVIYMDMAQRYQERAQMVISATPAINYMLRHPTDDAAIKLQNNLDGRQRDARIKSLSKTHGLFFFYAGSCAHCRAFAQTLKLFAQQFGFEVIAISLDGAQLPEFPDFKKNSGQAEKLGVKSLPAVFAIDPKNGPQQSILLSYGNVSVAELAQKLDYNYRHLTGQVKYEVLN
jgi:conjugal transfer pilus assembly protein TraF